MQSDSVFINVRLPRMERNLFTSEAKLLGQSQGEFLMFLLDYYKKGEAQRKKRINIFGK